MIYVFSEKIDNPQLKEIESPGHLAELLVNKDYKSQDLFIFPHPAVEDYLRMFEPYVKDVIDIPGSKAVGRVSGRETVSYKDVPLEVGAATLPEEPADEFEQEESDEQV